MQRKTSSLFLSLFLIFFHLLSLFFLLLFLLLEQELLRNTKFWKKDLIVHAEEAGCDCVPQEGVCPTGLRCCLRCHRAWVQVLVPLSILTSC